MAPLPSDPRFSTPCDALVHHVYSTVETIFLCWRVGPGPGEHERVGPVLVLPGNARCGPAGFDQVARVARPAVGALSVEIRVTVSEEAAIPTCIRTRTASSVLYNHAALSTVAVPYTTRCELPSRRHYPSSKHYWQLEVSVAAVRRMPPPNRIISSNGLAVASG